MTDDELKAIEARVVAVGDPGEPDGDLIIVQLATQDVPALIAEIRWLMDRREIALGERDEAMTRAEASEAALSLSRSDYGERHAEALGLAAKIERLQESVRYLDERLALHADRTVRAEAEAARLLAHEDAVRFEFESRVRIEEVLRARVKAAEARVGLLREALANIATNAESRWPRDIAESALAEVKR